MFSSVVWPVVAPLIGGGDFVTVETNESATIGLIHDLDWIAGIDGFQVVRPGGMRGIASRVQYTDSPFETFTIRYKRSSGAETELAKRLRTLDEPDKGWIGSTHTIHAYVTPDRQRFLSAGIVRTDQLYRYARLWMPADDPDYLYLERNRSDGNTFMVIPWNGLLNEGVALLRWPAPF